MFQTLVPIKFMCFSILCSLPTLNSYSFVLFIFSVPFIFFLSKQAPLMVGKAANFDAYVVGLKSNDHLIFNCAMSQFLWSCL